MSQSLKLLALLLACVLVKPVKGQFTNWSDYDFVWVGFTDNSEWTKKLYRVDFDLYDHVTATKNTLEKLGFAIIPENPDEWSDAVLSSLDKTLFIDIRHVDHYEVVWRYCNIDHITRMAELESFAPDMPCLMESAYDEYGFRPVQINASLQEEWEKQNLPYIPVRDALRVSTRKTPVSVSHKTSEEPASSDEAASVESAPVNYKAEIDALQSQNPVFGLYRGDPLGHESCSKYKLAVTERDGEIKAVVTDQLGSWRPDDTKAVFTPTAAPGVFIADWHMGDKKSSREGYVSLEGGMLTLILDGAAEKCSFVKTYPLANDNAGVNLTSSDRLASGAPNLTLKASGSAVVIDSKNGFLVTNHHVASVGAQLRVVFKNEEIEAVVVALDEANDLALLRINKTPVGLKSLPISINDGLGDEIVTAGYPLKGVLGNDIKVTEGIISSTSYLGSSNMYQISAPITNGSSGGALLDKYGNLAGITQGGFRPDENTENVNSAVKSLMILALTQGQPECAIETGDINKQINYSSLYLSVLPVNIYD